ncbi:MULTISPECIES: hypothetical protein [Methanobrevibacter]|uniref:Adhesin-like protein n=1 Tax=Methanobrevibacter gottschalkii DSM 11977 TaxID=1122229 RepID=A0A3N5B3N1_9EURY|nr:MULTISPECIES: hypothetical protein [Methanobrevibacter]OEC97290.1 hypothetical protein A9505_05605 [Methanobrevibacter sp. A27]RPF52004.1 hypothetical protein EDC42_1348 [Methanobrevibacter gottschalkii DSM 11977]
MDLKKIAIVVSILLIIAIGSFAYISLNTQETKVDIITQNTIHNGDIITVQLKDLYRNGIPNQAIDLKILDDSGWAHNYNATTDELGIGQIQILGLENGNYTAHAKFNGTLFLKESANHVSFEVTDGYF